MEVKETKTIISFNNNKKFLIINADDFGICDERDKGIFELFKKGCISSASILINGNNFENSIIEAKFLKMDLGLHLNLTEGQPVYSNDNQNNSLVNFNEKLQIYEFHGKFGLKEKIERGLINTADINNEITSQVKKII